MVDSTSQQVVPSLQVLPVFVRISLCVWLPPTLQRNAMVKLNFRISVNVRVTGCVLYGPCDVQ